MNQRKLNNLAKKEIKDDMPGSATQAWKRGYLYAMNYINEYYGDEINEISCLAELKEELDEAEDLHED